MKKLFVYIGVVCTLMACSRREFVLVSGRIENGDSVVAVWVKDSVYRFPLDENDFFSGKIHLEKGAYASLLPGSADIWLSPGEDVEIYANAHNMWGSLTFKGSLGGINTYLKEQEMMIFFNKEDYLLEEEEFVEKMEDLIAERTQLLEAKNFNKDFTQLEKQRIRFSVGEKAVLYPFSHPQYSSAAVYRPGEMLRNFLASFPLSNEELFVTKNYRKFLLSYVYFQYGSARQAGPEYSDELLGYILENFRDAEIRNFLLSEVVFRYIWENNGLKGAEKMLEVFRRECSDPDRLATVNEMVKRWEGLQSGCVAPDFNLEDQLGQVITLNSCKGSYSYIAVWATWCLPCKRELPYLSDLAKEYRGKNIRFITVSIDGTKEKEAWKNLLEEKKYAGIHTLSDENNEFRSDYMIISIPRFILLSPEGKIVESNAPRPSGKSIHLLFDDLLDKN